MALMSPTVGDRLAELCVENATLRRQLADHDRQLRVERHAAYHDDLTGLLNRRGFHRHASGFSSSVSPVVVMLADLDRFKPVNDRFGHAAGDQVLVTVGRRLAVQLGPRWAVARLGGDEFAAVCAGPVGADGLDAVLVGLREALVAPIAVAGHRLVLGVSVGVAVAPVLVPLPALVEVADQALYRSKTVGDAVVRFLPGAGTERGGGQRPQVRRRDVPSQRAGSSLVLSVSSTR